jgi:hypothetical protein
MLALFVGCTEEDCDGTTGEPGGSSCCKVCMDSKPCGDSCIGTSQTCHVGAGCACSGFAFGESVDAQ